MNSDTRSRPFQVLIAGGGVAALEAMMALRELAGDAVAITLLAPEPDFRYRPMAVAEPFSIDHAQRLPLAPIAADFDAQLVTGALARVDHVAHRVTTSAGDQLPYDALVIACGTRTRPAFDGAITIDDRNLGDTLRGLVQDIEDGYTQRIAFVAPAQAFWPLPLYELALLTAQRAYDANATVDIRIVSPEGAPLALFGRGISSRLSKLLHDADITFHGSSFARWHGGELTLQPDGLVLRPQRIVSLPLLEGPQITGVSSDPHGFIPISDRGEAHGQDGVYVAGDASSYPIKHGGVAAQLADVVAAAIAARAGITVDQPPLRPVIRGMLLAGRETLFFEAELLADGGFSSSVGERCPWDPPAKIAARHLSAYLARDARHAVRA
jgi:sulfide:quinone oxidoreductase